MFASFSDLLQLQVTIHSYDVFTCISEGVLAFGERREKTLAKGIKILE